MYIFGTDETKSILNSHDAINTLIFRNTNYTVEFSLRPTSFIEAIRLLRLWNLEIFAPKEMRWLSVVDYDEDRLNVQKVILNRTDVSFPRDKLRCCLIVVVGIIFYAHVRNMTFKSLFLALTCNYSSKGISASFAELVESGTAKDFINAIFSVAFNVGILEKVIVKMYHEHESNRAHTAVILEVASRYSSLLRDQYKQF